MFAKLSLLSVRRWLEMSLLGPRRIDNEDVYGQGWEKGSFTPGELDSLEAAAPFNTGHQQASVFSLSQAKHLHNRGSARTAADDHRENGGYTREGPPRGNMGSGPTNGCSSGGPARKPSEPV